MEVVLTAKQRPDLERLVAQATAPAPEVRRAQVVLWSADAVAGAEIARRLHVSAEAVSRIRRRFLDTGSRGWRRARKRGGRNHAVLGRYYDPNPDAPPGRECDLSLMPPLP